MKQVFGKPLLHFIPLAEGVEAGTLASLPDAEFARAVRLCHHQEISKVYQTSPDVIKRHIGEEWLLMPTGTLAQHFNGMVSLTEVGDFIWEQLQQPMSLSDLLDAVRQEFDGNAETIDLETRIFVSGYARMGFLNEVK